MKNRLFIFLFAWLVPAAVVSAQPVYLDLDSIFDTDAVLESGGAGIGDPLDTSGRRLDAGTLMASYVDGTPFTTQDGRASFLFAPFKQASRDAVAVNGQTLDVPNGAYQALDLALLSPDGYGDPFSEIEFRYADGTSLVRRFGPIADWFHSPSQFDNTFYSYLDDESVETILSFRTDWSDDESYYIIQERGNGNSGGNRFVDGTGYVLYILEGPGDLTEATLGVTVGNNFVISISAEYWDPEESLTEGYEVLANSMELYDNFEHRALGNLKQYEFDLAPYLAQGTGEIFLLFTDATPTNGWGPYIQQISVFTGENKSFEHTLAPAVDISQAEAYAMFQTDGDVPEKPFLYDNSGSGPSNRGHRFADGSGSITYRFDLPNDVDDAKLTMDLANNFVVSLGGPTGVERYDQVSPGTAEEATYLIDASNSILGGNYRFADASNYMIYQFDLPDDLTTAFAQIHVGNQFAIEIASGTGGDFQLEMDWIADSGQKTTDNSNLDTYTIDLTPYLKNNSQNIVQIRLSDGKPDDGWGPYLTGISIVNRAQAEGQDTFTEVLNSMDLYGEDIRSEYNKNYYTVDLSPVLQNNNPNREVLVKFTDGSTGDGWGPGIFWMAVYSGEIDIQSDRLVFDDLKTTRGDPANVGAALLHRRYNLDPTKTLDAIVLPDGAQDVYLLAATLNPSGTAVPDWMVY